jgi:hypothetical protein
VGFLIYYSILTRQFTDFRTCACKQHSSSKITEFWVLPSTGRVTCSFISCLPSLQSGDLTVAGHMYCQLDQMTIVSAKFCCWLRAGCFLVRLSKLEWWARQECFQYWWNGQACLIITSLGFEAKLVNTGKATHTVQSLRLLWLSPCEAG